MQGSAEFSLEALIAVLDSWGRPHEKITAISVAGTNGKGSTSSMIERILRESGVKTGLYTSPHIFNFRERIKINGRNISYRTVKKYIRVLRKKEAGLGVKLSKFEIMTAMAIRYFYDMKCGFCIMEAGLGGRLDATNVISNKIVSVITPIAVEHTDYLGDKIEGIASEKAGIIKPGSFVVDNSGTENIRKTAQKKGCRVLSVKKEYFAEAIAPAGGGKYSDGKYSFDYNMREIAVTGISPGLRGKFQVYNAATAITASVLAGFNIAENIKRGIQKAYIPGRLEIIKLPSGAKDIIDSAHNPAAVKEMLKEVIAMLALPGRLFLVMGVYKDKDYKKMAESLKPRTDKAFIFTPAGGRALPARIFAGEFGEKAVICKNFISAYKAAQNARKKEDMVLITGSFSVVRPALKYYR
ncbi:MAG: bifunctional folylpolyglutamate synthase/dihydrofolate synthase [Elusimicrobia bacterium]|nr:bifunctional folylpolyglutamate synthase/dihydrofolate synthase [Elusimicrobiota bacterium]